jgi:hypothetical protein
MVNSTLLRLFFNAILAYVLIYIDSVVPNTNVGANANRRIILIVIGYYSASYMFVKGSLALYHQIKWILS